MSQCTTNNCEREVKAKGLCSLHHQRWYRAVYWKPKRVKRLICEVTGCNYLAATTNKYCRGHQRRFVLYGDPLGGRIVHIRCTIEGCTKFHRAKGLCAHHYYQVYKKN